MSLEDLEQLANDQKHEIYCQVEPETVLKLIAVARAAKQHFSVGDPQSYLDIKEAIAALEDE